MDIQGIQFLRCGNVFAPCSGAVINLTGCDPARRLILRELKEWLGCLPVTLRWPKAQNELPQAAALLIVLMVLTEQARLVPDSHPARCLSQNDTGISLWLPVDDRRAAEAAAALVCHVFDAVEQRAAPDHKTDQLWTALRSRYWNQTHAHLARAAREMGVPCYRLDRDGRQFLQLGQGHRLRLCHETITDRTPLMARAAGNKRLLHPLLQNRGIPLPEQRLVGSLEQALQAAESIGWPVVLKPAEGGKGNGVWVGLRGPEALETAWRANGERDGIELLVQQYLSGADHRLLMVDGVMLAAAQRLPAVIISDGVRTLSQQIAALNADPERGVAYERLKNRVAVDERLGLLLGEQNLSLESVPAAGTRVQLTRTANISQGGTALDCSDRVHPDNRRLAEDIAALLAADVLGLDLISRDLGVSWRQGGTWLLEANLSPGLRPHLVANPETDLCRQMVRRWVGDGPRAGRIPTALITGSVGKTTTCRLLAHLVQTSGRRVALCSSTGTELDGESITNGDLSGGGAALQLLQDRRTEALVGEMARGGLLKTGLGFEQVDVAAVLNVLDNHVGMEGIQSREDLARIKALVATSAEDLLVLNANDPLVLAMGARREPASLALVAIEGKRPECWLEHESAGYRAASYGMERDGVITLHWRSRPVLTLPLRDIPGSDDGCIGTLAPAAAFAACLAHGLGLEPDQIREGLCSFGLRSAHQRGRFEVLMHEPWQVVLTWGDGPEAIASLARYAIGKSEDGRWRRRVLVLSAPDTRSDDFLRRVGAATEGFDLVLAAAWPERRGREPQAGPALIAEGVRSLGERAPTVQELGLEHDAVSKLAELLQPGDLCVVSSFASEAMRQRLLAVLTGL